MTRFRPLKEVFADKHYFTAIALLLMVGILGAYIENHASHAATVTINVNGATTYQTINGLGADVNPNSWDNGNLKPALDKLIDEEGMKTFRVGLDMEDWESSNDDNNANNYNWTYYDPIYSGQTSYDTNRAGSNFANTWAVIDYLHQKGIPDSGIILSNMGIGPSWMGGATLQSGKEDEYAEMMASEAYWGYSHGHTFGYFSPNNEMDISANEGVSMSDTTWADVMNRIAVRLNNLGMTGIKILGPETCCNVGFTEAMKTYPTLMAKLDHFDYHNYSGTDNGAASHVNGTGKDFWISEYASIDNVFPYLDGGASGLLMWEAYDSVYNHAILNGHGSQPGNDSLSFGDIPMLQYNSSSKTYTPRLEFYEYEHLFKFVPIGSKRVSASINDGNDKVEAFVDNASGRVTILGDTNDSGTDTITINLINVPAVSSYDVYQTATNSGYQFTKTATVTPSNNTLTVTIAQGALFTISGSTGTVSPPAPPPPPPPPTPSVTLTASPSTISIGSSSSLSWTSSNVTSCAATTPSGWTSSTATSGSQSVSPSATTTYNISCTGPNGSANSSATITVTGPTLVGNSALELGTDSNSAGEAEAFKYTAVSSGAASTLTFYVDSGSGATGLKVGIYSNNGTVPGTLLASGSASTVNAGAWNVITLTSNPNITTGTVYWIAFLGTGGSLNFRNQASGSCSQSNSVTGLTALPPTWSAGSTWASCQASAYVLASSGGSGGIPGDLNNDTKVSITDLSILLTAWGSSNATADINHDGTVTITDLSILLSHWTG
ncbi:MAG TPA: dockerin type I domain-containing protein [Candidatus Saccharimonadales bacterium]|nr:dockerin type I domain-containing protein [Candidatus Saccharimonadales bacterium]